MLDDHWQYPQMNMGTNNDHRIPILYVLPKAPASLSNAYLQAYLSIINASFQPQLQPLDNDPDFRAFSGGAPISTRGCSSSAVRTATRPSSPCRT